MAMTCISFIKFSRSTNHTRRLVFLIYNVFILINVLAYAAPRNGVFHRKLIHSKFDDTALVGKYVVVFTAETTSFEAERILEDGILGIAGVRRDGELLGRLKIASLVVDDEEDDIMESSRDRTGTRLRRQAKLGRLLDNTRVRLIEEQQMFHASYITTQWFPRSYGLDRIDQLEGLDDAYQYRNDNMGTGVKVYVLDTGVRMTHDDFEGRITCGYDYYDEDCRDFEGHGTHVAATVGGITYGVAKGASIIAVKVLDDEGSGDLFGILGGINYVAEEGAISDVPVVANMSLGGRISVAINVAALLATQSNVVFVTAAGNANVDACFFSPASSSNVLTVGATDKYDRRANFSNHGSCVDIFAPGEDIPSAWNDKDDAEEILSGTSMASPLVAGVAALLVERFPDATVDEIREKVIENAIPDIVTDPRGSNQYLLYTGKLLLNETEAPTFSPTHDPTSDPTFSPTQSPIVDRTFSPAQSPAHDPTGPISPSFTASPSILLPDPILSPTLRSGSKYPTQHEGLELTGELTIEPTFVPNIRPTNPVPSPNGGGPQPSRPTRTTEEDSSKATKSNLWAASRLFVLVICLLCYSS